MIDTLTKRELADRISQKLHTNQQQTLAIVQAVVDCMTEELLKGNRIEFRDFGVFQIVTRKARMALNPKTLEKIPIKTRRAVKFKAGRLLKQQVSKMPIEESPSA